MNKEVTIVTAFKDIGRSEWRGIVNGENIPHYIQRDTETYFERFERLTKLKNHIVVFSEEKFRDRLEKYDNVEFINIENIIENDEKEHCLILRKIIESIQSKREFIDFVNRKSAPEYWSSEYVLINYLKSLFIAYYIEYSKKKKIFFDDSPLAWIDFGYCRKDEDAPANKTFCFDPKDKINVFSNGKVYSSFFYIPVFNLIKTGDVLVQGCHIIAPADKWKKLSVHMYNAMNSLISVNLIDDDQTLLLMSLRNNFDDFILNEGNSEYWFNIIRSNCYDINE